MIKKFKKTLIITNIITILPMIVGFILWNKLPEQLPTHFNAHGVVDGWSSKPFTVFGLPLIMLVLYWICIAGTLSDPKKKNINDKMLTLVLWIIPIVSLMVSFFSYGTALGMDARVSNICYTLVGIIFIIVGNYLPKCKQSYTMGIKLPWTLNSEENWNKTHRMASWLWILCGAAILVNIFFESIWLILAALAIAVIVPTIYSFVLHKKGI